MQPTNNGDAEAEWARMQGLGSALRKKRFVATAAGMAVLSLGFVVSGLLFFLLSSGGYEANGRGTLYILVTPVAVMLPVAWKVRSRLWPTGQFR
jgi:hypothetical protein